MCYQRQELKSKEKESHLLILVLVIDILTSSGYQ